MGPGISSSLKVSSFVLGVGGVSRCQSVTTVVREGVVEVGVREGGTLVKVDPITGSGRLHGPLGRLRRKQAEETN